MTAHTEVTDFFGDDAVKALVEKAWESVFITSNKVIRDAGIFGFEGIEVIPNPNIHQMLTTLTIVSNVLDFMLSLSSEAEIDYDARRLILNAKQQILTLERVATALKAVNREDFNQAMQDLKSQATH